MLKLTNNELAVLGGDPIRQPRDSKWPIFDATEIDAIRKFINNREWWSPLIGTSTKQSYYSSPAKNLQDDFAAAHNCNYGISCSSGTAALIICLKTLGIGPGDAVIVPDYTWMATAQAVVAVGADPLFCDIIPETLNINPESAKKLMLQDVKAIIPVHMLGLPVEMNELMSLGVPIIEDACLAHGASYKENKVGGLGHMGAFSFNAYKLIAAGEGGMVTTNGEKLAQAAEEIANGQRYSDMWWETSCEGFNLRINQLGACIANAQLTRLDKFGAIREKQADRLRDAFEDIPGIHIQPKYPDRKSAYYGLPLFYDRSIYQVGPERMGEVIRAEGVDIATNYGQPLSDQPAFRAKKVQESPIALAATQNTLYFPHASLLMDDTDAIVKCFEKIYAKRELL